MGLKKELQETPQGQVVMLAVELINSAKEFSFVKTEDGGIRAGFMLGDKRVKIEKGSAGWDLNVTSVKPIPGQVQRKPRKKPGEAQ
ncbi:hypothetical protein ABT115_08780 [Streptomyces sp. NPDC001832]|uniref:hypothetical protein n=1 Tax=Streptomyces sp. NPDC001832 TaxID=3154527 RepID=UPI00331EBF72